MDGTNEKTCLLEISSLIFDSLEKVSKSMRNKAKNYSKFSLGDSQDNLE